MKRLILFGLVLVLLTSIVSAQDINLLNSNYVAGETVQAWISGTSISSSQVSLLGINDTIISISPLLNEYRNQEYLLYFNLPTNVPLGNYKLLAGALQTEFFVINGTQAVQMKPGIVVLDRTQDSFTIALTSVQDPTTVQVISSDSSVVPRKSALSVSGSTNLIVDYTYTDITTDSELTLSYGDRAFTIPIIFPSEEVVPEVVENLTEVVEETIEVEAFTFLVASEVVRTNTTTNTARGGPIKVQNNLDETITDITFSLTGNLGEVLTLDSKSLDLIEGKGIFEQVAWINRNNNSRIGTYSGDLVISTDKYSKSLPMEITISEISEEVEETPTIEPPFIIIEEDLPEEEQGTSSAIVIGIILIVLLIAIFIVVALRLRQKEEKKFHQYIAETKRKKK